MEQGKNKMKISQVSVYDRFKIEGDERMWVKAQYSNYDEPLTWGIISIGGNMESKSILADTIVEVVDETGWKTANKELIIDGVKVEKGERIWITIPNNQEDPEEYNIEKTMDSMLSGEGWGLPETIKGVDAIAVNDMPLSIYEVYENKYGKFPDDMGYEERTNVIKEKIKEMENWTETPITTAVDQNAPQSNNLLNNIPTSIVIKQETSAITITLPLPEDHPVWSNQEYNIVYAGDKPIEKASERKYSIKIDGEMKKVSKEEYIKYSENNNLPIADYEQ